MGHQVCVGPDTASELSVSRSVSGIVWLTWTLYGEVDTPECKSARLEVQLTKEQAEELFEALKDEVSKTA
jgi:hypothetical protein